MPSRAKPFVGFTTNGQLLTQEKLQVMAAAGLDEITISTHGTRRDTYERLMTGASHARHLDTLEMIRAVRSRFGNPRLRINYTCNPDNMDELRRFFDLYGPYAVSTLQIRPIFDLGSTEYRNRNMAVSEFRSVIRSLVGQCKERHVRLLVNLNDPLHSKPNYAG